MKVTGYKSRCMALLMSIVFPLQVMAGACDAIITSVGLTPGALGVMKGGTIAISQNGNSNCSIVFGGASTSINAASGSYTTRGTGCLSTSGTTVTETGNNLDALPKITYIAPAAGSASVEYKNSGKELKITTNGTDHTYSLKDDSDKNRYRWCKNNTGNGCNNNNKGEKDYIKYTTHLNSDWETFPTYSDNRLVLTNTKAVDVAAYTTADTKSIQTFYGYSNITVSTANNVYFKYNPASGPYYIGKLYMTNTAEVTFEPGDYYIGDWSTGSTIKVNVTSTGGDGSGVVKLYVNKMNWSNVNGSCINVSSCTFPLVTTDTAEHPERLYIYVIDGDFKTNDRVNIAAGIYVQNGTMDFGNNSATFIGEALAKNITLQNGTPMSVIYKDTGIFSSLYAGSSSTTSYKEGTYSLAAPAVHRVSTTGSLVYVPYQTDYYEKDDGTYSYTGGHLEAFPMNANGTTSSVATWDVNDKMSVWDRYAKLYSVNSTGSTVLFWFLDSAAFASTGSPSQTTIIRYTLDPTYSSSTYLGNRDPDTLIGQPYTTQPVIAENLNLVLFHTDDGFLYAVDATTGGLKWGFMPRANVAGLKDYDGFYKTHSMDGQIAVSEFSSGGSSYAYVVGSAKSGSLHYALKVTANSVEQLWEDTTSGTVAHRPVIFQIGSTYYALYLTGSKDVVVHALTSGASPNTYTMSTSGTLTAAPIVLESFDLSGSSRVQTLTLYLGDSSGYVYEKVLSSSGSASGSLTTVGHMGTTSSVADPVLYLQTATLGGYDYLTAQTGTRLKTFRLPSSSTWKSKWISFIGESGFWNDSGSTYTKETLLTPKAEHVQTLPANAKVTDQVEIAESVVFLPLQVEVEATGTREASCDAYYYLYSLDDGYFPYNTLHNDSSVTDNVLIGTGKAFKPSITVKGDSPMLLGHSEQNLPTGAGTTNLGVDDAFQFTRGEPGISGWRELVDE
jgi:hypothetical protein